MMHYYTDAARQKEDYSGAKQIGVDETSKTKGHDYVSLFVDLGKITFDKYHIMKITNTAVDDVRKAEVKEQSLLRVFISTEKYPYFSWVVLG